MPEWNPSLRRSAWLQQLCYDSNNDSTPIGCRVWGSVMARAQRLIIIITIIELTETKVLLIRRGGIASIGTPGQISEPCQRLNGG